MSRPTSFHTAEESIFQSALLEALLEMPAESGVKSLDIMPTGLGNNEDMDDLALALQNKGSLEALEDDPDAKGILGYGSRCARLVYHLAKARVTGDEATEAQLRSLYDFSTCDPKWAQTLAVATQYYKLLDSEPLFRSPTSMDDFIYPLPSIDSDKPLVVGLIADWGSGEQVAQLVLEEVCRHKPDLIIHLGDIYYSGTVREVDENFISLVNAIRAQSHPCALYNLPGNHDYYAGGVAFYNSLADINKPPQAPAGTPTQQASFFCLRNDHWQIQGMDTGYYDHDVFKHVGGAISPSDHMTKLREDELAWQRHQLENAGNRQIILLSHHQLFSAFGKIGKGYVNTQLLGQFAPFLDGKKLTAWFWGHEHTLQVYGSHDGLAKGRCVGHGAFPVFEDENPYRVDNKDILLVADPHNPQEIIKLGMTDDAYDRGYAILNLRPADQPSEAIYFSIPADGSSSDSTEVFREPL